MVQPENGVCTFIGASGKTYSVDFYVSDVNATAVKFDSGSGATSSSLPFWKCPENVRLVDLAVHTGTTATLSLILTADGGNVPGQRFRLLQYLDTVATRPPINIGFRAGTNFGLTESTS